MTDTSTNATRAMIKSFTDIVTPAVDTSDPIAVEQLHSAVKYLEFLSQRIDLIYDRERFELGHHLAMGKALSPYAEHVAPDTANTLAVAVAAGSKALCQLGANVPQMRSCTTDLTSSIRNLVMQAQHTDAEVRDAIERIVIDASEERILLERAWYLPLGFEHSPDEVPGLADVLASHRNTQST